jgi:hypothetical protein
LADPERWRGELLNKLHDTDRVVLLSFLSTFFRSIKFQKVILVFGIIIPNK